MVGVGSEAIREMLRAAVGSRERAPREMDPSHRLLASEECAIHHRGTMSLRCIPPATGLLPALLMSRVPPAARNPGGPSSCARRLRLTRRHRRRRTQCRGQARGRVLPCALQMEIGGSGAPPRLNRHHQAKTGSVLPPPSWRGQDWWGARDRSRSQEGDWRNPSSTPPRPKLSEGSSSGTSPYSSRSDVDSWRKEPESESSGTPSPHWSSSGTPPYHTGRSRSDVDSWRKEADDSPLTSPNITEATGWPQRPVPDLITAMIAPGILGRTPTIVILPAEGEGTTEELVAVLSVAVWEESVAVWEESVEKVWRDAMVKFLNGYKHPGHQSEFYKALLLMLKVLGKFDITVDFNHLKSWDKQLAFIICNGQGRDEHWLKEALSLFLNEHGLDSEDASIIFTNMPKRLKTRRDIFSSSGDLVTKVMLFKGRERAITSSYSCAQIVDAIISGVLARLRCGLSWRGKLTTEDIDFSEVNGVLRATITRKPEIHEGATGEDQVLDFHSLWPMIEPVVTWRGQLPLYFFELKKDLTCATAEEVTQPWFHDYTAHHPSLISSMGRRNFETGLYQTVNSLDLHEILELKGVLAMEPMPYDWRKLVYNNKFLKINFRHGKTWASQHSVEHTVKGTVATAGPVQARSIEEQTETEAVPDGAYHKRTAMEIVLGRHTDISEHHMVVGDASEDLKECIVKENVATGGAAHDGGIEEYTKTQGQQKAAADNANEDRTALEIVHGQEKETTEHQRTDDYASEDDKVEGVSGQDAMENSEGKDLMEGCRYENSIGGLIEFKRHSHNHPRVSSDDIDESEIFLASLCWTSLPIILRELLKNHRMTGKFESIWSAYKTSKSDPRRLTTPTNSPISDVSSWRKENDRERLVEGVNTMLEIAVDLVAKKEDHPPLMDAQDGDQY